MLGCSTVCPNCRHEISCCQPCCVSRRSLHALSGGGLISSSPQVSPSAPLSFVLPPFTPLVPVPTAASDRPETELQRLSDTVRQLRESGWYHEGLGYQQSVELLKDTTPGTFLVRDSSDPHFLFSLSVQTKRGPTSVRLHYVEGLFRLDAQPHLAPVMPMFPSVLDLVQHYVVNTRNVIPSTGGAQVNNRFDMTKLKIYKESVKHWMLSKFLRPSSFQFKHCFIIRCVGICFLLPAQCRPVLLTII